jgi:hypothetical protein
VIVKTKTLSSSLICGALIMLAVAGCGDRPQSKAPPAQELNETFREFGNYEDRKRRDDVRYILTYIVPSVGYESQRKNPDRNPVIQDVLDAYPNRTIIMTFDVAETATGHDRAALIDKFGREKD